MISWIWSLWKPRSNMSSTARTPVKTYSKCNRFLAASPREDDFDLFCSPQKVTALKKSPCGSAHTQKAPKLSSCDAGDLKSYHRLRDKVKSVAKKNEKTADQMEMERPRKRAKKTVLRYVGFMRRPVRSPRINAQRLSYCRDNNGKKPLYVSGSPRSSQETETEEESECTSLDSSQESLMESESLLADPIGPTASSIGSVDLSGLLNMSQPTGTTVGSLVSTDDISLSQPTGSTLGSLVSSDGIPASQLTTFGFLDSMTGFSSSQPTTDSSGRTKCRLPRSIRHRSSLTDVSQAITTVTSYDEPLDLSSKDLSFSDGDYQTEPLDLSMKSQHRSAGSTNNSSYSQSRNAGRGCFTSRLKDELKDRQPELSRREADITCDDILIDELGSPEMPEDGPRFKNGEPAVLGGQGVVKSKGADCISPLVSSPPHSQERRVVHEEPQFEDVLFHNDQADKYLDLEANGIFFSKKPPFNSTMKVPLDSSLSSAFMSIEISSIKVPQDTVSPKPESGVNGIRPKVSRPLVEGEQQRKDKMKERSPELSTHDTQTPSKRQKLQQMRAEKSKMMVAHSSSDDANKDIVSNKTPGEKSKGIHTSEASILINSSGKLSSPAASPSNEVEEFESVKKCKPAKISSVCERNEAKDVNVNVSDVSKPKRKRGRPSRTESAKTSTIASLSPEIDDADISLLAEVPDESVTTSSFSNELQNVIAVPKEGQDKKIKKTKNKAVHHIKNEPSNKHRSPADTEILKDHKSPHDILVDIENRPGLKCKRQISKTSTKRKTVQKQKKDTESSIFDSEKRSDFDLDHKRKRRKNVSKMGDKNTGSTKTKKRTDLKTGQEPATTHCQETPVDSCLTPRRRKASRSTSSEKEVEEKSASTMDEVKTDRSKTKINNQKKGHQGRSELSQKKIEDCLGEIFQLQKHSKKKHVNNQKCSTFIHSQLEENLEEYIPSRISDIPDLEGNDHFFETIHQTSLDEDGGEIDEPSQTMELCGKSRSEILASRRKRSKKNQLMQETTPNSKTTTDASVKTPTKCTTLRSQKKNQLQPKSAVQLFSDDVEKEPQKPTTQKAQSFYGTANESAENARTSTPVVASQHPGGLRPPSFDLSSVVAQFDSGELPYQESRLVNSQEIHVSLPSSQESRVVSIQINSSPATPNSSVRRTPKRTCTLKNVAGQYDEQISATDKRQAPETKQKSSNKKNTKITKERKEESQISAMRSLSVDSASSVEGFEYILLGKSPKQIHGTATHISKSPKNISPANTPTHIHQSPKDNSVTGRKFFQMQRLSKSLNKNGESKIHRKRSPHKKLKSLKSPHKKLRSKTPKGSPVHKIHLPQTPKTPSILSKSCGALDSSRGFKKSVTFNDTVMSVDLHSEAVKLDVSKPTSLKLNDVDANESGSSRQRLRRNMPHSPKLPNRAAYEECVLTKNSPHKLWDSPTSPPETYSRALKTYARGSCPQSPTLSTRSKSARILQWHQAHDWQDMGSQEDRQGWTKEQKLRHFIHSFPQDVLEVMP